MARIVEGFYIYPRTYPRIELTVSTTPDFAFPAEAGLHLPDGWKAELA